MRDTSELPDGAEQVKTTRAKPPARSRPESATPGSRNNDTRSAPRRRTTTAEEGISTTDHQAPERAASPAASTTRSSSRQQHPTQRPTGTNRGAPSEQRSAPPPRTQGAAQSPATTGQRAPSSDHASGHGSVAQRSSNAPSQQRPHSSAGAAQSRTNSPHAPGGARQVNRGGNAPARPAPTQGHPAGGRPGGRPATSGQRPQERRAPVVKEKPTGPVSISPQIVVKDLAELLHATPNEVIRGLIKHGVFANINQIVDYEQAALVAQDLGFEPTQSAVSTTPTGQGGQSPSANEVLMAARNDDNTVVVPPVVAIMGHVDHGKTSLLDTIRKTKVAAGEAGGITQHIGAYQVEVNGKKITFLDTPGHEAFTAMRARGAQGANIAIIVIAADDGVMPQTREAIAHAQAAKVPIIIAINKIDKDNANPDHVKQQLAEMGILIEEYGGDIVSVPVSARKGIGIDDLLEYILLVAEVQDIRANPNRPATGVIIEARLEKNIGPMATVLVQQGTLKMGDNIVVGALSGKVRAMFNDRGKRIQKAPPSTPVSIIGVPEVPQAGDRLEVVPDERTAKQRAQEEVEKRQNENASLGQVNLDTLYMQMQEGKVKELNVILKSDVQGSAEAIKNALSKVGEENLKVRLIHEGIGNISETDVHLAGASGAIILGFNVKTDGAAQREAQREGVEIRHYDVIYQLIDDIQAALTGMLEPTYREVIEGHAEVIQTFKAGKNVVIAGCRVTDGRLIRSSQVRVLRGKEKAFEGKVGSLRRGKDDVREVASGYECGLTIDGFNDFQIGDIVETFAQERVTPGR